VLPRLIIVKLGVIDVSSQPLLVEFDEVNYNLSDFLSFHARN